MTSAFAHTAGRNTSPSKNPTRAGLIRKKGFWFKVIIFLTYYFLRAARRCPCCQANGAMEAAKCFPEYRDHDWFRSHGHVRHSGDKRTPACLVSRHPGAPLNSVEPAGLCLVSASLISPEHR